MIQKIKDSQTRLMNWWCGVEQEFPKEGTFTLVGGPHHLETEQCFITANEIEVGESVYRKEFLGFEDSVYHQIYVHERVTKGEALDLLLERTRHDAKS